MAATTIEWTEATWNPVTGCSKISPGCAHCYAERMSKRLKAMGQANYVNGFEVTLQPHMLDLPLQWRKPQMIFVNSMSDLFHEDVPFEYIESVFAVMAQARQHRFQVLTKRSERLRELAPRLHWSSNIWMGVTVENADYVHRIDDLRTVPAAVRMLSLEPLLSALPDLTLRGIGWVIAGGESGPGARWSRNGSVQFVINASGRTCRSSSNNGAAYRRSARGEAWTGRRGMKCQWAATPTLSMEER